MGTLLGTLEWIRVEELEHQIPQYVHSRRQSGADHRKPIGPGGEFVCVRYEGKDRCIISRPRQPSIRECTDFNRKIREIKQRDLARTQERHPHLGQLREAIATILDLTGRTVRRDWVKARAWLYRELNDDAASDPTFTTAAGDSAP